MEPSSAHQGFHHMVNSSLKGRKQPLQADSDYKATQRVALVNTSRCSSEPEKFRQYIESWGKTSELIIQPEWSLVIFEEDSSFDKILAEPLLQLNGEIIFVDVKEMSKTEVSFLRSASAQRNTSKVDKELDLTDSSSLRTKLDEELEPVENKGCCLVACCGRQSADTRFSFKLKWGRDCYLDIRSAFFLGQMYQKTPE